MNSKNIQVSAMGIERFYSTIINSSVGSNKAVIKNLNENVDVDYLYIDFNSIIYYIAENKTNK